MATMASVVKSTLKTKKVWQNHGNSIGKNMAGVEIGKIWPEVQKKR